MGRGLYVHAHTGTHGDQKRGSNPLKLELQQVLVSHQMWVLRAHLDPLQKHYMLVIVEPSPQPPIKYFLRFVFIY